MEDNTSVLALALIKGVKLINLDEFLP